MSGAHDPREWWDGQALIDAFYAAGAFAPDRAIALPAPPNKPYPYDIYDFLTFGLIDLLERRVICPTTQGLFYLDRVALANFRRHLNRRAAYMAVMLVTVVLVFVTSLF